MIQSRLILVIGVAVLTVLAGCLGGGAGVDGGVDVPDVPGGDGVPASGAGDSGAGDGVPVLSDPESALRDAGSFTAAWRYAGTDGSGATGEAGFTYRADLAGGRVHVTSLGTGDGGEAGSWETFTADGRTFTRFGSAEGAFYQVSDAETDVVAEALSNAGAYGSADFEGMRHVGTETFDGVTVDRYETTTFDSLWGPAAAYGASSGDLTVTEFTYVVLVDGDGLSRFESWSFEGRTADGKTVRGSWEYSLTGVGSTVVDDPDWLAEARQQAAG